MVYQDRAQAGRILAERLLYLREHHPVVVGVANGGVVVAREIAESLDAPLDALMVRKIPEPGYRALAMGAVGEGAVIVSNHDVMRDCRITPRTLAEAAHREHTVIARERATVHRDTPALALGGRVVVLAQLDHVVDQVICLRALRWRQSLYASCHSFPDVDANDVAATLRDHADRAISGACDAMPMRS